MVSLSFQTFATAGTYPAPEYLSNFYINIEFFLYIYVYTDSHGGPPRFDTIHVIHCMNLSRSCVYTYNRPEKNTERNRFTIRFGFNGSIFRLLFCTQLINEVERGSLKWMTFSKSFLY